MYLQFLFQKKTVKQISGKKKEKKKPLKNKQRCNLSNWGGVQQQYLNNVKTKLCYRLSL